MGTNTMAGATSTMDRGKARTDGGGCATTPGSPDAGTRTGRWGMGRIMRTLAAVPLAFASLAAGAQAGLAAPNASVTGEGATAVSAVAAHVGTSSPVPASVDSSERAGSVESASSEPVYYSTRGAYIGNQGGRWFVGVHSGYYYSFPAWFCFASSKGCDWRHADARGWTSIGWFAADGYWYYSNSQGALVTGWLYLGHESWYYLHPSGRMATGWLWEDNQWYYLQKNGIMAHNGWYKVSGQLYWFDSSGRWVP